MFRKISSITIWLVIFGFIVAVQAYSTFAQASGIKGSWTNGSVGAISYQNRVTGATKPGRGSIFTYKFLPNGNYEFVGYMEITMYNCTTTLFNQITGRYRVNGSSVDLEPVARLLEKHQFMRAEQQQGAVKDTCRKVARVSNEG